MTVTYTHEVATCNKFGTFWKLLFRWKGGIYKLVWPELFVYTFLYYICSIVYRFLLDEPSKRTFEKVSLYCQYFSDLIPVSFVLGFYVSIVVQRWWNQYQTLPWPDSLALFISTSIHGQDERGRLMRRTIMRYCNLSVLFTFIMIAPGVKKRFPTRDHLVEAGFMTENEQKIFDDLDTKTPHPKYWMPLVWAGSIVARARKEGRIRDDFAVKTIIDEINRFRGLCGGLLSYDWISIPLVYTQVVTLAVYTFFIGTIMGRQFLDPKQNIPKQDIDFYVPIFTFLQFFFYMGWLKVAESLVNPFGEDDDDFEVNWLVDRNLQVSYLIVDEMHSEHPELIQDKYWDEIFPTELPYTIAAEQFRIEPPQGSTANLEVPEVEQEFLPLVEEEEEEEEPIHGTDAVQELENGETKAIDIKLTGSRVSSASGLASPPQSASASRKPSILSQLVQRMKYGSNDNLRRRSIRPIGSTTSMRTARKNRGFNRSASRMSSTSQVTSQSRESVTRNPTLLTQGSGIFRMSDLSINTAGRDDPTSPKSRGGVGSQEDDEPIHIKIKRRDKDGRVIKSPSSDEFECESESSRTNLIGNLKKPGSRMFSYESMSDENSEDNNNMKRAKADNKSLGSSCSIRTSIFQGDDDENEKSLDVDEKIAAQLQTKQKRGVIKGLKGAFSKIRIQSHHPPQELSRSAAAVASSSYTLSKWLSSESSKVYPVKSDEDEQFADEEPVVPRTGGVSCSLPVSPARKVPSGGSRTAKSLGTFDSDTDSCDLGSLLDVPLSPPESPMIKINGKSIDQESEMPIGESTPQVKVVLTTPEECFLSPQKSLGDTKIDISKDTEDLPEQGMAGSSEKVSKDTSSEAKLSILTEKELEPIPEIEDNSGGKNTREMWV
ncbi:bestrophin homolog 24-like isoform X1 [Macrobrachium rosenbergii]|uniref:bestrophin homolog 24-like isoform X1 n=2 Tax=Macrobrachium rosenbergii TaxID=79674 RepID=UPI0034D4056E